MGIEQADGELPIYEVPPDAVKATPPPGHASYRLHEGRASYVYTLMAMIFGNKDHYHLDKIQMVHVDDVARAHIFLFEYPEAKGRYVCSSVDLTLAKMSGFLSARYSEYPIPKPDSLKERESFTYADLLSKKLLHTGFEYKYGLEEIYDETIQCCKDKGFL